VLSSCLIIAIILFFLIAVRQADPVYPRGKNHFRLCLDPFPAISLIMARYFTVMTLHITLV
jgi:hypothetical protein